MKRIFCVLTLLFAISFSTQAQLCSYYSSSIYFWSPNKGTIPQFMASCIKANKNEGFIIILGRKGDEIYTIEGGMGDDAGGNLSASLAITSFNGTRSLHLLYTNEIEESYETSAQAFNTISNKAINKLSIYEKEGDFNLAGLIPINYAKKNYGKVTDWAMKIENKQNGNTITWRIKAYSEMCWCNFEWAVHFSDQSN